MLLFTLATVGLFIVILPLVITIYDNTVITVMDDGNIIYILSVAINILLIWIFRYALVIALTVLLVTV